MAGPCKTGPLIACRGVGHGHRGRQCRLYRSGLFGGGRHGDAHARASATARYGATRAIKFHDTWHTIGLCGTSSGDVELDNVQIPVDIVTRFLVKSLGVKRLYKMPYFGFLATGVAAVAENAKSALQDIHDLARTKPPPAIRALG